MREWFRKRREYMSQRIFQVCAEVFKDLKIDTESELELKISELNHNTEIIDHILLRADLEITDETVAKEYCNEKVINTEAFLHTYSFFRSCPISVDFTDLLQ